MRLKTGDVAPLFTRSDILGNTVDLEALRGHHVLLGFHRFSSCPFCNLRVHHLRMRFSELHAKGLEVVTVFESSTRNLRDGVAKQDVPFPIISDPDLGLYRDYGAETSVLGVLRTMVNGVAAQAKEARNLGLVKGVAREGDLRRMPADFLIAPDGRVHTAYYGKDMGDHLDLTRGVEAVVNR